MSKAKVSISVGGGEPIPFDSENPSQAAKDMIGSVVKKAVENVNRKEEAVAGQRLKSFVERIERLEEEKRNLSEDVKEVYAEAKTTGFDTPTIRTMIKLRKLDAQKRQEKTELLRLYSASIGMQLELPL